MFGKNFFNFSVVIQNDAFVLMAKGLYLIESKNDKSNFLDLSSVVTLLILILLFIFGKILFIEMGFFFFKKKR